MTLLLISLCPLLTLPVMPRQDGKVVIVTGGARGIGYEIVRHMVGLGAHVIIGTLSSHALGRGRYREWIMNVITKKETKNLMADCRTLPSNAPTWTEICSFKYDIMMCMVH